MDSPRYIAITPVRNDGPHLAKTVASMASQTLPPVLWVIVNDGSSDNTKVVADAAAAKHSWIQAVHRADRGFRKPGGGVIEAFYDGYALIQSTAWNFLAKLDGDLSFAPDYFQEALARFEADPKLGIGGGRVYCRENGSLVDDSPGDPPFHVRGATKIYRRSAWDAIGGLVRLPGWDTLDELKANMLGWTSRSFADLKVEQLKPTGSADGICRNSFKNGRANYITGYHPAFMMFKCLKRAFLPPFIIGAAGLAWGYCNGYFDKQVMRVNDAELIRYIRHQQIRKLTLRSSIWD